MLALDTEDDSDGHPYIINFYDGIRHVTFVGDECRLAAWNYLLEQAPEMVWACNVEYDLINLFGPWLGKMVTLQYMKAGLIRGSLRDARITFYDTLRHWPMTVQDMGEYIGKPKLDADYRSVDYCRRDTEIVWLFVSAMLARYDDLKLTLKSTLPSMAMQLWRRMSDIDPSFPEGVSDYCRKGYYGGRVEVYQFGEITGPVNHYDINSLFPYVMRERMYPDLRGWREVSSPDWQSEGMASVSGILPQNQYPCLPVRSKDGLLYPYGYLTGTWTYAEIRQAIHDGFKIHEVMRAVQFPYRCNPFRRYVDYGWQKRFESTTMLDNKFWKLMLNSLYGKFGQNSDLIMIYQDRDIIRKARAAHANVIWSAYVTSYARLELLSRLRSCSRVYYTDTDSIFTPDTLDTSSTIGSLKKEGTYSLCEFVGKKLYTLDGEAKAKGVPKGAQNDFIRTGKAVYLSPARYRESRHNFKRANVWYEIHKHLLAESMKRKILPDGSTEPWRLDEYRKAYPEERMAMPAM